MPTQKWRVLVTKLGVDSVLYEGEVDASNWMSALRAAREGMAERPSVPPGVSCSIDGQGVATVLDPGSRRRFLLAPGHAAAAVVRPQSSPAPAAAPRVEPHYPPVGAAAAAATAAEAANRGKRFETVAFQPDHLVERPVPVAGSPSSHPAPAWPVADAPTAVPAAAPWPAPAHTAVDPSAAPTPAKKKKFETVAFAPGMNHMAPPVRGGAPVHAGAFDPTPRDRPAADPAAAAEGARGRAGVELELLFERNEEPTGDNPLFYCERAYLLPRNTSVPDAEAALRWKLAGLQTELDQRKRGKLVNLAVFDHRWSDVPERPPVITLQWRDWRGEVVVDYPAAARQSSAPPTSSPPSGGHDDRLAEVFEALGGLSRMPTAADALDFGVKLIDRMVPSQAVSACLYDINTDELRFVAVSGEGAAAMQGRAVPRTAGLFAQAARLEHHASVFKDLMVEHAYDPAVDSRPGVDAVNMLLRPIVYEHQLLGMLQLINRRERPTYSAEDAHLVSYVAERLAEYIHNSRKRRSQPPSS